MIIGLTGGIASGKSTIAKTFAKHNIPIVDADIVARQVVEPGKYGLNRIAFVFGKDVLLEDGTLNRKKLGELVFSNDDILVVLNRIMLPLILEEASTQMTKLYKSGHKIIVYDAALICENGNADKYRPLIVAHCSKETQLARLIKRNGLTEEQAMKRINAQMSSEDKIKLADYSVDTNGTIESSIQQTKNIIGLINEKWT